ncbi:MAG TPA: IscS subfamily cysteine desulfurase [Elusimicrobiota bacterium]|nr:IscS subfamily cysteine desulfurase [Elusimicrobiota bacterium]
MHTIYLDYNATTPMRPELLEAVRSYSGLEGDFGNPSSLHTAGQRARAALERAREQVAGFLGASDVSEIVFTSGGTEADNLAIQGAAFAHRDAGRHIITSSVEHSAVMKTCRFLETQHGFEVTYLPVDRFGRVSPEDLRKALRRDTVLVSLMAANNEIGTVEPLMELGAVCRERGVLFHSDAVQAAGRLPIDVKTWPVDMLAVSGHKIYAPKGIGALWLRRGTRLQALQYGGSHEKNRRAGTENVAGAAALGLACELAGKELEGEVKMLRTLRDRLEQGILARIPLTSVNGHPTERLCNTTHIAFECVEGESLLLALDQAGFSLRRPELPGICVSTGSACSAGLLEPSHVLSAIGVPPERLHGCVRFSLGHYNTQQDVDQVLEIMPPIVEKLRSLSPLWDEKRRGARSAG